MQFVDGKAADFFNKVTPVLEANPARYYNLILSSYNYTDETIGSELINFYSNAQSIDREASTIIGEIVHQDSDAESEEDNADFKGLAVFKAGTMVGEISSEITDAHLIVTNALKKGTVTVNDPDKKDALATATIRQLKPTTINIKIEDNIPKINISAYINAHLEASNSATDYLDKENKIALNNAIKEEITVSIYNYLEEIRKLDADIVGFGKYAKKSCLTWKEYEELKWQDIFKNSEFSVNVKVNLDISRIVFHKFPNKS